MFGLPNTGDAVLEIAGGVVLGGIILWILVAFAEPVLKLLFWILVAVLALVALAALVVFLYKAICGFAILASPHTTPVPEDRAAVGCASLMLIAVFLAAFSRIHKWYEMGREEAWEREKDFAEFEAKRKAAVGLNAARMVSPPVLPSLTQFIIVPYPLRYRGKR